MYYAPDYGSGLLRGVNIFCCVGVLLKNYTNQHKIIITKSVVYIKLNFHLEVDINRIQLLEWTIERCIKMGIVQMSCDLV